MICSTWNIQIGLGRLKTGTPPRLLRRSIQFSQMQIQPGDEPVPYFSYWKNDLFHVEHSDRNWKTEDRNATSAAAQVNTILADANPTWRRAGAVFQLLEE